MTEPEPRPHGTAAATAIGLVLVGLGIVLLAQQVVGFDLGKYGWPALIVLPGLALLAVFALGGRGAGGLAVPGCVVTTVGLLLAVMNAFNLWQTWAYAWGLVVASVGLGLILQGERLDQQRTVDVGVRLLEGGVLAFVVLGVFFELVLDLSHVGGGTLRGVAGPLILILVGLFVLVRREHWGTRRD